MKESYKQQRHDNDLNQPLSVQSWGRDGDKRRYWLIEGQDDTHFRLYRESNPALKHTTWRSVAGTIDEVKAVAERLGDDNSQASKRLRERITLAIPRFEASEEVGRPQTALSPFGTLDLCTDKGIETQAPRLPQCAESSIHPTRTRFFTLRGSYTWKENKIYLFRRGGRWLGCSLNKAVEPSIRTVHSC